jgi:hypothetical protein
MQGMICKIYSAPLCRSKRSEKQDIKYSSYAEDVKEKNVPSIEATYIKFLY